MSDITPQPPPRLTDELEVIEKRATPAPWDWWDLFTAKGWTDFGPEGGEWSIGQINRGPHAEEDTKLIVALRNAAPALIEASKQLAAALAAQHEAEAKLAMVCAACGPLRDAACECRCGLSVGAHATECVTLTEALEVATPLVAAFTARLKRQGAAEERERIAACERECRCEKCGHLGSQDYSVFRRDCGHTICTKHDGCPLCRKRAAELEGQ